MLKYLALSFVLVFGVLAWMYFGIGETEVYGNGFTPPSFAHLYNGQRSIGEIAVTAFYFVPKDKAGLEDPDWKKMLGENFFGLQKFHSLQFGGLSRLDYEIYPSPVIGKNDAVFYDTEITEKGNPRALIAAAEEIDSRVFGLNGDLHIDGFGARPDNAYPVMFIMYEGVGASGGVIYESELESSREIAEKFGLPETVIFKVNVKSADGFFLANKDYLGSKRGILGGSVFAHEFYHTLGAPDSYYEMAAGKDASESEPVVVSTSGDIMGFGRFGSLEATYLRRELLSNFGL